MIIISNCVKYGGDCGSALQKLHPNNNDDDDGGGDDDVDGDDSNKPRARVYNVFPFIAKPRRCHGDGWCTFCR